MTTTKTARVTRRALGALAALLLIFAAPGAASAFGGFRESDLVGRWDLTVTIHIEEPPLTAHLDCVISADHLIHCVNMPDTDPLEGRGVWKKADGNAFGFWITHHAHRDANGDPVGSIYAVHLGRFTHNRFSTTAYTYIDMHDGSAWIGPVAIEGRAFRIGS
jgi:hypothetical protein